MALIVIVVTTSRQIKRCSSPFPRACILSGTTLQILELNLEVRHPHLTAVDILCGIDFKSGCEISWVVNQIGIFVATV